MADCKNCLHYRVCESNTKGSFVLPKVSMFFDKGAAKCIFFTDKSEYIHLPCKVGDVVHKVSFVHKNITPLTVDGFLCNLSSWKVHCSHLIPSWGGNQKEHIYIALSSFGKTVFLTREEAKRALEEGKNK